MPWLKIKSVVCVALIAAATTLAMTVTPAEAVLSGPAFTWGAPEQIKQSQPAFPFASVSCASANFCIAVDDGGDDAVQFDGTNWGAPTSIDPGGILNSVSVGFRSSGPVSSLSA